MELPLKITSPDCSGMDSYGHAAISPCVTSALQVTLIPSQILGAIQNTNCYLQSLSTDKAGYLRDWIFSAGSVHPDIRQNKWDFRSFWSNNIIFHDLRKHSFSITAPALGTDAPPPTGRAGEPYCCYPDNIQKTIKSLAILPGLGEMWVSPYKTSYLLYSEVFIFWMNISLFYF